MHKLEKRGVAVGGNAPHSNIYGTDADLRDNGKGRRGIKKTGREGKTTSLFHMFLLSALGGRPVSQPTLTVQSP